jgi:2,3,4,5-tetrahydropyridine-2-carboxylate N-succinyltransferase
MQTEVDRLFDSPPPQYTDEHRALFSQFKQALNRGEIRAAEPDLAAPTGWRVNAWVKKGILVGFRMGAIVDMSVDRERLPFFDKSTYPVKTLTETAGVRVVPGGSSIRDGCFVGRDVICMPPMFINVGAYVGDRTLIDSHALVGSCAQVGRRCHISAAAQIGGVLEPVGAMPVIIEDDVLVGGNCGVYEGTVVKRRAVLGSGVILTRSTPIYDVVKDQVLTASADQPLIVPEGAVVVPGARKLESRNSAAAKWGLSLYAPVIVKYRDERTDAKAQLEDALRP